MTGRLLGKMGKRMLLLGLLFIATGLSTSKPIMNVLEVRVSVATSSSLIGYVVQEKIKEDERERRGSRRRGMRNKQIETRNLIIDDLNLA